MHVLRLQHLSGVHSNSVHCSRDRRLARQLAGGHQTDRLRLLMR